MQFNDRYVPVVMELLVCTIQAALKLARAIQRQVRAGCDATPGLHHPSSAETCEGPTGAVQRQVRAGCDATPGLHHPSSAETCEGPTGAVQRQCGTRPCAMQSRVTAVSSVQKTVFVPQFCSSAE